MQQWREMIAEFAWKFHSDILRCWYGQFRFAMVVLTNGPV